MRKQLSIFEEKDNSVTGEVVNVASVPQRSPFRYPGGKTWLIPVVRQWLRHSQVRPRVLIEPFAGGGIVSLTAAFEKLADRVLMVELDDEIAAVWETVFNGKAPWLAERILTFQLTPKNIQTELDKPDKKRHEVAFCTILKNRIYHGGILAKGSGMLKHGENGKGIFSRWYPKTLHDRILAMEHIKTKTSFVAGDGFSVLENYTNDVTAYSFVDPPYTVAGRRLYTHFEVDHERLFRVTANLKGKFMMTYDDTTEIRQLARKYDLEFRTIPMKTTHHLKKNELIISDNFHWWST